MKKLLRFFLWPGIVCAILLMALPSYASAQVESFSVTFVSPSTASSRPFWNDYISFMRVAAKNLGVDLTVLEADNRFEVNDLARKALHGPTKPDYLVYIYQAGTSITTLKMAGSAGVKTLIVNTDVVADEKAVVGAPREIYRLWIGHIFPDDVMAGGMLAKRLIDKARRMDLQTADKKIHIIGLGGNLTATSSLYRKAGFANTTEGLSDVVVDRFVLANWKREVAHDKTSKLLSLYPEVKVFWAINDHTAMGVLDAINDTSAVPGKDILTGGIDWSPECIEKVLDGSMVTTIGGHFMEGAWALIMLLDYHNGHDFAQSKPTLKSEMRILDSETADTYLPALDRNNWPRIDFRQLSKTYNPELGKYDFSPDAITRQLSAR